MFYVYQANLGAHMLKSERTGSPKSEESSLKENCAVSNQDCTFFLR